MMYASVVTIRPETTGDWIAVYALGFFMIWYLIRALER